MADDSSIRTFASIETRLLGASTTDPRGGLTSSKPTSAARAQPTRRRSFPFIRPPPPASRRAPSLAPSSVFAYSDPTLNPHASDPPRRARCRDDAADRRPTDRSVALAPEAAPLREPRAPAGGLAQHRGAAAAEHHRLGVREHRRDVEATLVVSGRSGEERRAGVSARVVGGWGMRARGVAVNFRVPRAREENVGLARGRTWHFTSMKNEFGDCTRRLSLCLRASRAAGGWSRSMS